MAEDNFSKYVLFIVGAVLVFAVLALVLGSQRPQEARVGAPLLQEKEKMILTNPCNPQSKVTCKCPNWGSCKNCGCPSEFTMKNYCQLSKSCDFENKYDNNKKCSSYCCTWDANAACDKACKETNIKNCIGEVRSETKLTAACSSQTQDCYEIRCKCTIKTETTGTIAGDGLSTTSSETDTTTTDTTTTSTGTYSTTGGY